MKLSIALALLLAAIWLLNSGHYTPLLLALMVCSTGFVVLLCQRMGMIDNELLPLRVISRSVPYFFWLGKQLVLSNVDVLRRIWVGPSAVSPVLETLPINQKTDVGRVLLANSITLTPGTVSVVLEQDCILVHALSSEGWESLRDGDIDRRVRRLEE